MRCNFLRRHSSLFQLMMLTSKSRWHFGIESRAWKTALHSARLSHAWLQTQLVAKQLYALHVEGEGHVCSQNSAVTLRDETKGLFP